MVWRNPIYNHACKEIVSSVAYVLFPTNPGECWAIYWLEGWKEITLYSHGSLQYYLSLEEKLSEFIRV